MTCHSARTHRELEELREEISKLKKILLSQNSKINCIYENICSINDKKCNYEHDPLFNDLRQIIGNTVQLFTVDDPSPSDCEIVGKLIEVKNTLVKIEIEIELKKKTRKILAVYKLSDIIGYVDLDCD
jgi:hypothetical protein